MADDGREDRLEERKISSGENVDNQNLNNARTVQSSRVAYIFNEELIKLCDQLPKIKGRVRPIYIWMVRCECQSKRLQPKTATIFYGIPPKTATTRMAPPKRPQNFMRDSA